MKTTATISQEELEQKAVDSMMHTRRAVISGQENEGGSGHPRAASLRHREGHREIVLKGWIIKPLRPRQAAN
ncbi:hypothetical protein [Bacteroides xylanisolvens]|uniref:hypothetical protein n=1 Tax=Bacteroides xylanisolvens TaxID=371601 RepID=UPI001CE4A402|nr:hypothetical protein [Bacteroides xylanisolvens]